MRIIAGEARGRNLCAPEGAHTRPSSDRLKEALFGSIQFDLRGAIVLDLFSGSGALGLEAVSRGAGMAYCNDNDRESIRCIVENVQNLGFDERVQVSQRDYTAALKGFVARAVRFDFIFLDPPYAMDLGEKALALIAELSLLTPEGRVFWEYEQGLAVPEAALAEMGYRIRNNRRYGKAGLSVLDRCGDVSEGESGS